MIKHINKIKAHSLNDSVLLYTAVRLLSKGVCMTRFYSLYDSVIEFLSGIDCQLAEAVKLLKNNIAFSANIFTFLNEVNKKFQGKMITLIWCKSVITLFISKLSMYKENMG